MAELLTTIATHVATALGTTGVLWKIIERRTLNAENTAVRQQQRDAAEEAARDRFRDELHKEIDSNRREIENLRLAQQKCEEERRKEHETCIENRAKDREEIAALTGRVNFLTEFMYDNPQRGNATHARTERPKRPKR